MAGARDFEIGAAPELRVRERGGQGVAVQRGGEFGAGVMAGDRFIRWPTSLTVWIVHDLPPAAECRPPTLSNVPQPAGGLPWTLASDCLRLTADCCRLVVAAGLPLPAYTCRLHPGFPCPLDMLRAYCQPATCHLSPPAHRCPPPSARLLLPTCGLSACTCRLILPAYCWQLATYRLRLAS